MNRSKVLYGAATLALALFAHAALAHEKRNHPHAVTLWWVIFNNPDACLTAPDGIEKCGAADVFGQAYLDSVASEQPNPGLIAPNTDAGLAVIYATGGVTNARTGRLRLAASIYRSDAALDLSGSQVVDPLGLGTSYRSTGAEVHLIVRDHGRARRDGLLTQITNFLEPYCSDPLLLFEAGDNLCADVQYAIFAQGEAGLDGVFSFANGMPVHGASAYLVRQGDMLQAVVETRVRDRRQARRKD